jgi:ssDNA-binding replication factor A large subunit
MSQSQPHIKDFRPGMDHLNLKVKITKLSGIRKVKTYTGVEHSIFEGEISDGDGTISFAVWNEKIESFNGLAVGDDVELTNCFVTSFKGILQVNVGRDSDAAKIGA